MYSYCSLCCRTECSTITSKISFVPFTEDDSVVGTIQAGDGHVGQLKFLKFSHVWGTVGGRRGNERPDEMYECLQTQGHLESNNNDNKLSEMGENPSG